MIDSITPLKTPLPNWLKKFSLEDKVAIITGAGSGLGKEVSKGMALSGASVILVDINLLRIMQLMFLKVA